jgi:hypothetical protein
MMLLKRRTILCCIPVPMIYQGSTAPVLKICPSSILQPQLVMCTVCKLREMVATSIGVRMIILQPQLAMCTVCKLREMVATSIGRRMITFGTVDTPLVLQVLDMTSHL